MERPGQPTACPTGTNEYCDPSAGCNGHSHTHRDGPPPGAPHPAFCLLLGSWTPRASYAVREAVRAPQPPCSAVGSGLHPLAAWVCVGAKAIWQRATVRSRRCSQSLAKGLEEPRGTWPIPTAHTACRMSARSRSGSPIDDVPYLACGHSMGQSRIRPADSLRREVLSEGGVWRVCLTAVAQRLLSSHW